MRARMALLIAVAALVLAGCGGGSGGPRRVTIALDFTTASTPASTRR
jgi:hypothetical protein